MLTMAANNNEYICIQKEKITSIEKDITDLKAETAELNARLDNKKDDIYSINNELIRDRETQTKLLTEVTELKVLLKQSQEDRKNNSEEIVALRDAVNNLETKFTAFQSSVNSFKNTMLTIFGVGTPIISIIVAVILHFWGI